METTEAKEHHSAHVDPLMGIILPYANFAIFIALLIYFAKKPAAAAAEKKRQDFEKLVAEATKAKVAAQQRLDELNARQLQFEDELKEIQTSAILAAETEALKIVSEAEHLAEHIKAEAKRIAEAEVLKAKEDLRKDIVSAVKDSVTQKIKSEMTVEAQHDFAKKQVVQLSNIQIDAV